MELKLKGQRPYRLNHPDDILTPRLLVFEDRIHANIAEMKALLNRSVPGSGFDTLCAHVKTHKSARTLGLLQRAGVQSYKASLNEVDLCLAAGVPELFVAYPLLEEHARWLAVRMKAHPETQVTVQFGSLAQAEMLRQVSLETDVCFNAFLDLDVGMHRTGSAPESAFELYSEVSTWPEITLAGVHGYDGHIHQETEAARRLASQKAMGVLCDLVDRLTGQGLAVPRVVAAGSPSFFTDLPILAARLSGRTRFQVSPGTWIYWDTVYDSLLPGAFEWAAVILARVLERHGNLITLNLGHKRWAADQGPVHCFSIQGAEMYSFNEEHTVLTVPASCPIQTGDPVLIAPRHVCPTVNLWEHYTVIGADGEIIAAEVPVDGRNR